MRARVIHTDTELFFKLKKMKKKTDKFKGRSLRLSIEADRQLVELMRRWGENASAVVRRAIALAYASAGQK